MFNSVPRAYKNARPRSVPPPHSKNISYATDTIYSTRLNQGFLSTYHLKSLYVFHFYLVHVCSHSLLKRYWKHFFFFFCGGGGCILYLATLFENRCDVLVVRASASRSGGRGIEPRPGHTKDFKMVPMQGRRQGVCFGGGGAKCLATAAASLESCVSPEKANERGGGGGSDTYFFPTSKNFQKIIIMG